MKVDVSDNKVLRIPKEELVGAVAPVYIIGLPDDVMKLKSILEELK
jgi:hypothetical protein